MASEGRPRPAATLRVGIRVAADDAAAAEACLAAIAGAAADAIAAAGAAFAPGAPVLRLICTLPDDIAVARAAAAAGWHSEGIAVRATDDRPAVPTMILGDAATDADDPAARRAMADRILVAHSDLIVIAAMAPGSRHLVAEAACAGVPVVRLRPADDTAWAVEDGLAASTGDLASVVRGLLAPPPGDGLRRFYDEPWRAGSHWVAYEWLGLLTGRRPSGWRRIDYGGSDAARSEAWAAFLAPVAGRIGRLEDGLRDVLRERFLRADNLALHLGHVYRSAYVLGFALAALAVLVGVVAAEAQDMARSVLLVLELAIIAGITTLTRVGRRRRWHRRWLDCRRLAEILRLARLRALTGQARPPAPGSGSDPTGAWVDWYARATLRELPLPDGEVDRARLHAIVHAALDGEIGDPELGSGEIGYHSRSRDRLALLDRRLDLAGALSFALTAMVAVGLLALAAGERLRPGLGAALAGWEPAATLLVAGFPAIGAALAGIRAQGEFRFLAERSTATRAALLAIRARLLHTLRDPTLEAVDRDLTAATDAMGGDVEGWQLVYRARDLTLPG